ncbi:hemolysin III [Rubricella aquisinus]|uniref:Hemolysin III n=1 Tax=Rubricella aquisinus TaxID=2028108 RepID=A0A840X368_9RHOB|nr:hemolysin III family protein [Rubricella aquisinus]MBB5516276.1 hemolysin III [Rubricella aquisinus]
MTLETYPSAHPRHRRADMLVHAVGLMLVLGVSTILIGKAAGGDAAMLAAIVVYAAAALASNLASWAYHFLPWHDRRVLLRRIDHAAIYPSIVATFTPFFVHAGTTWTLTLLVLCWLLTGLAIWKKLTDVAVKSRWSTASYLLIGGLGLLAIPDLEDVPQATVWFILSGSVSYLIGTAIYVRKALPYRYAIWHAWANMGGLLMFFGIWQIVA